jgi:hypothetical protein
MLDEMKTFGKAAVLISFREQCQNMSEVEEMEKQNS